MSDHPPDPYGAVVTWVDRAPGPGGPLAGLRVGVKDLIAVEGVPRLCGAPDVVDATPQLADAEAVRRLVDAGAQIVATLATHEFGWGVITPGTANPRARGRIAGGSSGGSAAALAAGIVDGALGTDTAGSIRIPAACCGVVGLKPTEGLVPRDGVQPLAPSLDTVGPMARDVATVAALHSALVRTPVKPMADGRIRIGVVTEVRDMPMHDEVRGAWETTLAALRSAGARLTEVEVPLFDAARPAFGRIIAAEEHQTHRGTIVRHRDRLTPEAQRAFSDEPPDNEKVLAARRTAALLRDWMGGVFDAVDALVLPVMPCLVPEVGAGEVGVGRGTDRVGSALTRFNGPWNLAGVPAGALPVARDSGGAPIGMQVVGPWRNEACVLGVMQLIERLTGGAWGPVRPT